MSRWKENEVGGDMSLTRFNSTAGDMARRRRRKKEELSHFWSHIGGDNTSGTFYQMRGRGKKKENRMEWVKRREGDINEKTDGK